MRAERPVVLQILWVAEIIVSLRILLFIAPVAINQYLARDFSPRADLDWFMIVITLTALLYLLIGIASVIGYRFWGFLHYGAVVLVLLMTAGLYRFLLLTATPVQTFYFLPLFWSILIIIGISLSRQRRTSSA